MASVDTLVNALLAHAIRDTPSLRTKLESDVGEIALEMIQKAGGKFAKLKKTQTISIDTTNTTYLLDPDFNKPSRTFNAVDSDGDFVCQIYVIAKAAIQKRMEEGSPTENFCYIEYQEGGRSGRGYYIVLPSAASSARTFEFDYYRHATERDVDIIEETTMLKRGVRGRHREDFETWRDDAIKYSRFLDIFESDVADLITDIVFTPSLRQIKVNRLQHRAGRQR
jgi:hypothetical protein